MGGENLLLPFDGISLFEWSSIISDVLPTNIIRVDFRRFKSFPDRRQLTITNDN